MFGVSPEVDIFGKFEENTLNWFLCYQSMGELFSTLHENSLGVSHNSFPMAALNFPS